MAWWRRCWTSSESGTPYLGICMGMQALMTYSEEHGGQRCLDIIPGRVRRIETTLPVPHMGWNQARPTPQAAGHPLLRDIAPDAHVYFVHSYVCEPTDRAWILAETQYGDEPPFASIPGAATDGHAVPPREERRGWAAPAAQFRRI